MISTYAELVDAVVDWSYRSDVAARVPNFIALCEADMQVRCKLVEFEGSATVPIIAGSGTLPAGFTGMRAAYWDGDRARPLRYVTPDRFESFARESGQGTWYTITGTSIRVTPGTDGNVVMTYKANFTPLSESNPTNVILSRYPDAYLHGSLLQLRTWCKDKSGMADAVALYEPAVERIVADNNQRKYAGVTLQVRPR